MSSTSCVLPDPVQPAQPLLDLHRVPRQVHVDHDVAELQVAALAGRLGGQQDRRRRRGTPRSRRSLSARGQAAVIDRRRDAGRGHLRGRAASSVCRNAVNTSTFSPALDVGAAAGSSSSSSLGRAGRSPRRGRPDRPSPALSQGGRGGGRAGPGQPRHAAQRRAAGPARPSRGLRSRIRAARSAYSARSAPAAGRPGRSRPAAAAAARRPRCAGAAPSPRRVAGAQRRDVPRLDRPRSRRAVRARGTGRRCRAGRARPG